VRSARRLVIRAALVTAIVSAAVVAAMAQTAQTATTKTSDTPTFTLAVPLPLTDFGAYTMASLLHFDTAYGINLKILPNTGGNTANLVASGQADAASFTAATAVSLSEQGKQTSVFFLNEYQPGIALVGAPDITTLAQLRSAKNCRLATPPPGSSTYYAALIYVRENNLKNCTIVQTPTQGAQVQGTVAGAYQATVLGYSGAVSVVQAGGHWLIDPTTAQFAKTYGRSTFAAGMVFGLKSGLQSKRPAVIGFLRATLAADNYINTHGNGQLVSLLQKDSSYATQPAASLALGYFVRPYLGVNSHRGNNTAGHLDQSEWQKAITAAAQFGVTSFDAKASAASYANAVDMSYYKAAFPHVAQTDAKNNTLAKLAQAVLGSSSKWKTLYATAKPWMDTLGVSASRIPNVKFQPGTFFWWN
jgi:hypothetical protein